MSDSDSKDKPLWQRTDRELRLEAILQRVLQMEANEPVLDMLQAYEVPFSLMVALTMCIEKNPRLRLAIWAGSQLVFSIEGISTGYGLKADEEILELLKPWKIRPMNRGTALGIDAKWYIAIEKRLPRAM